MKIESERRVAEQAVAPGRVRIKQRISLKLEDRHELFDTRKRKLLVGNGPAEYHAIFEGLTAAVGLRTKERGIAQHICRVK